MAAPSWGIVMTVDEPAPLVLANVAWHLSKGAAEVHVFLDRPDDPVAETLSTWPGCHVTRCDAAHWAGLTHRGTRPDSQMRRQSLNANAAYAMAGVDWLIHLDANEFLHQSRPLEDELARIAEFDCELNIPVAERFYTGGPPPRDIFEGCFRLSTKGRDRFDAAIFGADLPLYIHGMLGHSAGKCAVPTGGDYIIGIHWSFRGVRGKDTRAAQYRSTAAHILHFDGLTGRHWLLKMLRYADADPELLERLVSSNRHAQIAALQACDGELRKMLELHDRLRVLDAEAHARLTALGLILEADCDPLPALNTRSAPTDGLTVAAFDVALAERYPDLARRFFQ